MTMTKTITIVHPRVTPIAMRGKKTVWKVERFKGCYLMTGYDKEKEGYVFTKTKC